MKTKTSILDILIAARERLLSLPENERNYGLCGIVCDIYRRISGVWYPEEEKTFYKYYIRTKRNQKWFYDCDGYRNTNKRQFGWKMGDKQSRLRWLDVNIKRLQDAQ